MTSKKATKELFYRDSDMREFEAEVLEVSKGKTAFQVILNQTAFYPEGGGQPADRGWINGIPVIDVQKKGELIIHHMMKKPEEGEVKGKIDMEWRRDFMQQHTGQHIISGSLWEVGRYRTVSVHMGKDYTTIDIDTPDIPEDDLIKTEELANQIINRNLPIRSIETDHRELDKYRLRKPVKVKGKIRLMQIGDFDCVGCGGLHFESTGRIGLVKAVGIQKIRGQIRIVWKIGDRAIEDYRKKDKIISGLRSIFESNEEMFVWKARELKEELTISKKKVSALSNQLADNLSQILYKNRQVRSKSRFDIIIESWKGEDENLIKKVMKNLLKRERLFIGLVNTRPKKIEWSIGCSNDITFPFDKFKEDLLSIIDGKGGGRFPLWHGTGSKPYKAETFLSRLKDIVKKL
jgi:alanyl-tRNA synthetase